MEGTNKIDEMLSKSLDEVEKLIKSHEDNLSKGMGEEPNPEDVSEDAPQAEDEGTEEGADEGAEPEAQEDPETDEAEGEADVDADADTEAEENADEDDEVEKSLYNNMSSTNESIRKSLEVSEYLDTLTKGISAILGEHGQELKKSIADSENNQLLLAKSFQGIIETQRAVLGTTAELHKSLGTLTTTVNQLASRLEVAEATPLVRKSVASSSVKPLEKSFANTQQTDTAPNAGSHMKKSEALAKLTTEAENGNPAYNTDILALESTGKLDVLSPDARKFLGL